MNMPRSHETTGLINRENAVQIGAGAHDEDETVDVPPMSDAQMLAAYRLLGDMQRVMDVLTTNDNHDNEGERTWRR
jgi:hypothetical protein